MTLQQLRYVVKIAECASITQAAKQLFISQPSLSAAVKDLESEFDIEIFNRTTRGISLTAKGVEFLSYARQLLEQSNLLEAHYHAKAPERRFFSVSTQHYAFSVKAFSDLISKMNPQEYELTLRETRTYEIIEDVRTLRSEIGVLYMNDFNTKVLSKIIKESGLTFHPLFEAQAHIFITARHPLAKRKCVELADLEPYPWLTFDQGAFNAFYFFEEPLSTLPRQKVIHVNDRATLFNLLIGLNGYTICTGILHQDLDGRNIISLPLNTPETLRIGYLTNDRAPCSRIAVAYLQELRSVLRQEGYDIPDTPAANTNLTFDTH